ncbi:helix-turn-helix domain-containing protein [Paenibacillus glycanilyticus]|uniref:HTH-type transcriptional regulator YtdP n=1 Tax=Paenibacillus glycanilyticus TaxID=126569 RepID=A0ABQ6GJ08_9BACL|nr:helix-turn-helix domain-containing protein [Paenibacillus glycanilyticus]GLX69318.1 putative HTH-type transcriptional regulator YtdP [Paenibacillus glycanilyticus]
MNIRSIWQKRKSIIVTWLMSYCAVLFVPILISLIVYSQSSAALRSEIHRANDALLKQVGYTIDNQVDEMKRLTMELTWNARLQTLMYSSRSEADAQFDAYQLVKEFQTYQTSYASIDEFYVTWEREHAVLRSGNVRDMKTAFATLHDTGQLSYDDWLAKVENSEHNQFTLLPLTDAGDSQTSIAYITHLPKDLNGRQAGTVVVMTDLARFQDAIKSISGFSGGYVLILNRNNEVLLSNLPKKQGEEAVLEKVRSGGEQMPASMKSGDSEIFYLQSFVSDLKYALVIPSSIYWQKAEYVRKLTLVSILISLMGAGVLTWFFMRRNYSPIQQLVQSLSDKNNEEEFAEWNELNFIQRAVSRTRSEKDKIAMQLQMHQTVLRSNMLSRLLKGRMDSPIPYEEAFKTYRMEQISDQYAVILFVVENDESLYEKLPGIDENERRKFLQFIISNVVEELAGRYHHAGYVAEVDDMMVCLVNLNDAAEGDTLYKQDLFEIATEAQRFLKRYDMDLTVAISGRHNTLAGIAAAYSEAVDAMEYKMVLGKKGIIAYEDILSNRADEVQFGYYYPLQAEQQLINLIKIGDFEQASSFMNDITDRNFRQPMMNVTLAKCFMFNLVGTMVKAMNELGDGKGSVLNDNPNWMNSILACDTVQEMQQELHALLHDVCAFATVRLESNVTQERADSIRDLSARVAAYIEENYSDSNMNVNTIGEHFDLKGSYLSKLFKTQTGEGLLDYLHKYRIQKAKHRMTQHQESVSEVSRTVGYNDAATFIRVFKKYEGITPGKYKEMN